MFKLLERKTFTSEKLDFLPPNEPRERQEVEHSKRSGKWHLMEDYLCACLVQFEEYPVNREVFLAEPYGSS